VRQSSEGEREAEEEARSRCCRTRVNVLQWPGPLQFSTCSLPDRCSKGGGSLEQQETPFRPEPQHGPPREGCENSRVCSRVEAGERFALLRGGHQLIRGSQYPWWSGGVGSLVGAGTRIVARNLHDRISRAGKGGTALHLACGHDGRLFPDVVAQRWRVNQLLAAWPRPRRVYPTCNLVAFAGFSDDSLSKLFNGGQRHVGAGPALSLSRCQRRELRGALESQQSKTTVSRPVNRP